MDASRLGCHPLVLLLETGCVGGAPNKGHVLSSGGETTSVTTIVANTSSSDGPVGDETTTDGIAFVVDPDFGR